MLESAVSPVPEEPLATRIEPPTVAAAIAAVMTWNNLTEQRRVDMCSALRTLARYAGLPVTDLRLEPSKASAILASGTAATFNISTGRLANLRTLIRAVLGRYGLVVPRDLPIAPEWKAVLHRLDDKNRRGLTTFARFCTSLGVTPQAVSEETIADFADYLARHTLNRRPRKAAGDVRREWNRAARTLSDWPGRVLVAVRNPDDYQLALIAFVQSFQMEAAVFNAGAAHRSLGGAGLSGTLSPAARLLRGGAKPRRKRTLKTRADHLRWAASALVASGTPITEITGLRCLVDPIDNAWAILNFLLDRNGGKPSAASMHVHEVLVMIAKHHLRLDRAVVETLKAAGPQVRVAYKGMTEKNHRTLLALTPERMERLLRLPDILMRAADSFRGTAPHHALALALRATAIGLLLYLPLRLENVIHLRPADHLVRPAPGKLATALSFPAEDTKTSADLLFHVDAALARRLEHWMRVYRPMLPAAGCPYLFPSVKGDGTAITPQALREAIKQVTADHVGVRLSPHQFRHLAAKVHLDNHPGDYESIRQLLGHAHRSTAMTHYAGLTGLAASRAHADIVTAALRRRPVPKKPGRKGR